MHFAPPDPTLAKTTIPLRVRFCETDLMAIVHHASYLGWFEAGRVEWLRRRGVRYADWASRGLHLPVVEVQLRYRQPARFDDLVEVETILGELRAASLRFDYRITRDDEGTRTLLAEGSTRLACIDDNGVRRFTDDMLAVLRAGEIA